MTLMKIVNRDVAAQGIPPPLPLTQPLHRTSVPPLQAAEVK